MDNRAVRTWLVLVVVVLMGGSFAAGVSLKNTSVYGLAAQIVQGMPGLYDYEIDNEIPSATDLRPLATFWEVREKILRNFVYLLEDSTQLTYGAIRGMLDALEDPYSRFLTPEEYAEFNRETEGTFEGIGAWVAQEKEEGEVPAKTIISSIIPGGPAAQVDIMPGDQILAVDEMATEGLTLQKVVKMIQGPAGTSVVLTLKRESRRSRAHALMSRTWRPRYSRETSATSGSSPSISRRKEKPGRAWRNCSARILTACCWTCPSMAGDSWSRL